MASSDLIKLSSRFPVVTGNMNQFEFEIRLGKRITEGEGFILAVPVGWTYPQTANPLGGGYTTIQTDRDIEYQFTAPLSGWQLRLMRFVLKQGTLPDGAVITIVYGDTSQGGPGVEVGHATHREVPFPYTRKLDVTEDFMMEQSFPGVDILPNQPAFLTVRTQANQVEGHEFNLYIGYEDAFGNRVADADEELRLLNSTGHTEENKAGAGLFRLRLNREGCHHLAVFSERLQRTFFCNPIQVFKQVPDYQLYFGEIHGHSDFSDAVGTLDDFYQYARDFARLDFCAVSNHDMGHNKNALSWYYHNMTGEKWRETVKKAAEYYQPGEFVTFSALEFSHNPDGHMNLYCLHDDPQLFDKILQFLKGADGKWPVQERLITTQEIIAVMKDEDYLLIPHHPGMNFGGYDVTFESKQGSGCINWANVVDEVSPVAEVYSKHGNSVRPYDLRALRGQTLGCFMEDILKTGRKFGFIGGSDTHYGNPGSRQGYGPYATLQYPTGLAAVYAKELTREGIFEALRARRCYATTYARIILKFSVNGHFMGESFTLNSGKPELSIEVYGEGRIKRVDIFKNGHMLYSEAPVVMPLDIKFEYRDETELESYNYYYVRVVEAEGDMAWSSPVFVHL